MGTCCYGGDSSAVQGELKDQVVQQIYSTGCAFAALLGNGRVVTWGHADYGGDSSAVQGELKDQVVQQIYSTDFAFAAVLGNGRVVTWGDAVLEETAVRSKASSRTKSCSRFTRLVMLLRLVLREWPSGDVGRCSLWRRQQCGPRRAQGPSRAADLLDWLCFCGSLREWPSGDVGRC